MFDRRQLTLDIAGGGPTGMVFALALLAYGVNARIRIFDPRWRREAGRVEWRGPQHGNRRREQIVTIQSKVCNDLPQSIRHALFDRGDCSQVWPCSSDSPGRHGAPRNLPIRDVEDRLLDALRNARGVERVPERYDPSRTDRPQLLAICEGAHSPTREHFIEQFGRPHPELYRLDGRALEETHARHAGANRHHGRAGRASHRRAESLSAEYASRPRLAQHAPEQRRSGRIARSRTRRR